MIGALAIPDAYESDGLAFGLAYLAVVLLHGAMYVKGTSVSEVAAILRIVPYNLTTAGLVVLGGALGGDAQWVLWTGAAVLLWCTPWFTGTEGFLVSASHFVERHGLVIIVALGESVVVIGVGAADLPLDLELVVVALLSLALSASLWWLYFRGEDDVERAMDGRRAVEARSPRSRGVRLLALRAAARRRRRRRGAEEGGRASVRRARTRGSALELAVGVALFTACTVGFRATLGLGIGRERLLAAAVALATIPLGLDWSAMAQLVALTAIVVGALVIEAKPSV